MPPCGASPAASMRSMASGIDAAEVFPVVTMSRATGNVRGKLQCSDQRIGDADVRLVRDECIEVDRR